MVQSSPMLFLDEFQLPDRVASKTVSNLMTSFFQLGGVLIATSNRMTEDLVKAMGMGFPRPPLRLESLGWRFVMRGVGNLYAQHEEFAAFLEILKVRCETWEMEGSKDYRRIDIQGGERPQADSTGNQASFLSDLEGLSIIASEPSSHSTATGGSDVPEDTQQSHKPPKHYFVESSSPPSLEQYSSMPWTSSNIRVYGRTLLVPRQNAGTTSWAFSELCGSTLSSAYDTLISTNVPIMTALQKNEARGFITLLDALYEARCKLLITAEAGPDDIFFPEIRPCASASPSSSGSSSSTSSSNNITSTEDPNATYVETFSEACQDATAPFWPNIQLRAQPLRRRP